MLVHLSFEGLLILQIIVASVIPSLVAFIADSQASSKFKTGVTMFLSALGSALTELLATPDFDLKHAVIAFFGIWAAAIAAHKNVTKDLDLSGADSPPAQKGLSLGT